MVLWAYQPSLWTFQKLSGCTTRYCNFKGTDFPLKQWCGKSSYQVASSHELPLANWSLVSISPSHYDIIKWKHLPRNWPFVRGIHRSPVNSPLKGQWRGALVFSLICAWINGWVNNRQAGDLRRHGVHYDVKQWFLHNLISITIHFVRFQILFKR